MERHTEGLIYLLGVLFWVAVALIAWFKGLEKLPAFVGGERLREPMKRLTRAAIPTLVVSAIAATVMKQALQLQLHGLGADLQFALTVLGAWWLLQFTAAKEDIRDPSGARSPADERT